MFSRLAAQNKKEEEEEEEDGTTSTVSTGPVRLLDLIFPAGIELGELSESNADPEQSERKAGTEQIEKKRSTGPDLQQRSIPETVLVIPKTMGVKDGCTSSSCLMRIAFLVLLGTSVFSWYGFCTASWGYVENDPSGGGVGLWRTCDDTTAHCSIMDGTRNKWYMTVQALGIFGFMSINIAFLLVCLYMYVGCCHGEPEIKLFAILLCFLSATCYAVAVQIFYSKWPENPNSLAIYKLGPSFHAIIGAAILAIVSGVILVADSVGTLLSCRARAASIAGASVRRDSNDSNPNANHSQNV